MRPRFPVRSETPLVHSPEHTAQSTCHFTSLKHSPHITQSLSENNWNQGSGGSTGILTCCLSQDSRLAPSPSPAPVRALATTEQLRGARRGEPGPRPELIQPAALCRVASRSLTATNRVMEPNSYPRHHEKDRDCPHVG